MGLNLIFSSVLVRSVALRFSLFCSDNDPTLFNLSLLTAKTRTTTPRKNELSEKHFALQLGLFMIFVFLLFPPKKNIIYKRLSYSLYLYFRPLFFYLVLIACC